MKILIASALWIASCCILIAPCLDTPLYAAPIHGAPTVKDVPESRHVSSRTDGSTGAKIYADECAICHGKQQQGNLPAFPSLIGVERHMTAQQIADLIRHGKGRMPGFLTIQQQQIASLVRYLATSNLSVPAADPGASSTLPLATPSGITGVGGALFQQNCAFCHGRDAEGGETGPDLTRSKLVQADENGDKISEVVRNGRPEKKMPAFNFSHQEMLGLAAFIHAQVKQATSQVGKRRGVEVSDLQTGNVKAGLKFFNGDGTCVKCHSATGDLAGIASRYQGLQLEQRMLFPRNTNSKLTVTLPSGERIIGTTAYVDEFTVALRDSNGIYRSWSADKVKYSIDAPVNAHAALFSKYTDADIHNLMAYLQTLRSSGSPLTGSIKRLSQR